MKLLLLTIAALVAFSGAQQLNCGQTPIKPDESRIVGGKPVVPYSWPWQVQLCVKSSSTGRCSLICGGSIIDDQHILSAAHCVEGRKASSFAVKLGIFKLADESEDGVQKIDVLSLKAHPDYHSPNTYSKDWSVLKLKKKIVFSDRMQPVCLPKSDNNVTSMDRNAVVTGWGTTRPGGSLPDRLMQVRVPFVTNDKCAEAYPGDIDISMVCAGNFDQGGVDSCQGDSGGPLVVKASNGRWYEYGVVSWGRSCAAKGYPGVYARVTEACDFIKKQTGKDLCVGGNN